MERVVYVLGAGFSAPLGLPVMGDFIEKAKDQFFDAPEDWRYFEGIHEMIMGRLGYLGQVYHTDLTNIENVLSIIEMLEYLDDESEDSRFRDYIIDVIRTHTPLTLDIPDGTSIVDGAGNISLLDGRFHRYLIFVFYLLGRTGLRDESGHVRYGSDDQVEYSVVSLNYDLLLEKLARIVGIAVGEERNFFRPSYVGIAGYEKAKLAKLHGSVEVEKIIAPTWNKNLEESDDVTEEWKLAFDVLSKANHIRFIGYSLPAIDAYVKYLFRAAMTKTKNLKFIDVLCLDDAKWSVERRYREFVAWPNFRFVNKKIEKYLDAVAQPGRNRLLGTARDLETAHSSFFNRHASGGIPE